MFEVGKKYKVRDLNYFKKHSKDFAYYNGKILSYLERTSHFMTPSMLRKKEVTIVNIINAVYSEFITIEEDDYTWEPWMLVDPKEINTIMKTE